MQSTKSFQQSIPRIIFDRSSSLSLSPLIQSATKSISVTTKIQLQTTFCSLSALLLLGTTTSQLSLPASLLIFLVLSCLSAFFLLRAAKEIFLKYKPFHENPSGLPIALRIKSKILNYTSSLPSFQSRQTTRTRHTDSCPSFFLTQSYFSPENLYVCLSLFLEYFFPTHFVWLTPIHTSRLTKNVVSPWRSLLISLSNLIPFPPPPFFSVTIVCSSFHSRQHNFLKYT